MKQVTKPVLHAFPAHLYDGDSQLPGKLELWEHELVFRFANFEDSHLQLTIQFNNIQNVEEFLIYDIARNGLRIIGKNGKHDLFVLEDSQVVKQTLEKLLKNLARSI